MKLPLWVWIFAVIVCWPSMLLAAETFRARGEDGKDAVVITLRDGKCADKHVLEYLRENVLDDRRFKKADLLWGGQKYGACWIDIGDYVHAIGSDKKPIRPPIPRAAFKDESI